MYNSTSGTFRLSLLACLFALSVGVGCSEDSPVNARIGPPPGKSCFDFQDYLHTVSRLETAGRNNGVTAAGDGFVYVAGDGGLQIIDARRAGSPGLAGTVDTTGAAWDVAVAGGVAHVAWGNTGLVLVDANDPASARIVGAVQTPGSARGIDINGGMACVADDVIGLMVFDVSDPSSPGVSGIENTPGKAMNVVVSGALAYVADEELGLRIVNVADPEAPWLINTVPLPGRPIDVCFYRGYALVAAREGGLHVVNVSVPGSEFVAGSMETPGSARGVSLSAGVLFIADESSGVRVVSLTSPPEPELINVVSSPRACRDVAASGGYAYSAEADGGVRVIDVHNPLPPPVIDRVLPNGTNPGVYDPSFFIDSDSTLLYGIARGQALFIAELLAGTDLEIIGEHDYFYLEPAGLLAGNDFAVVADRGAGGDVYDVTDPYSPAVLEGVAVGPGTGMDLADSVLYATNGSAALAVARLNEAVSYTAAAAGAKMVGVAVSGGYAFVTSETRELIIADVSDYTQPFILARKNIDGSGGDILIGGGCAYIALASTIYGGQNGVAVYDLQYPFFPTLIGIVPTFGRPLKFDLDGGTLYVALGEAGLEVIDVSDPLDPVRIGAFGTDSRITDVAAGGGYVYVAEDDTGIFVTRAQSCAIP